MNNDKKKFSTRFAPSPTGALHVGNIRTALLCWLMAKNAEGQFILRIDNTNENKSDNKFIEQIKSDLKWLNLNWDDYFEQKNRKERYLQIADQLKQSERIYPCYESKEQLEEERRAFKARNLPMIYRQKKDIYTESSNKMRSHWRFKIDLDEKIKWNDLVKGQIELDPKNISDPIIIREDGSFTYMLPSSVDDIDYNITTVLRGDDHITNTAIQIQMIKAIQKDLALDFAHVPLLHIESNSKISKRNKEEKFNLEEMKEKGILPTSIKNYLCNLGTNITHKTCLDDKELIKNFSIKQYNSSSCQFNFELLEKLNASAIKNSNFEEIQKLFPILLKGLKINQNSWELLKNNIKSLNELKTWDAIINNYSKTTEILEKAKKEIILIKNAILYLPKENIDLNTCETWINEIKCSSDCPRASIYKTLRLCLTGLSNGPELFKIFELLGKSEVLKRLKFLCDE